MALSKTQVCNLALAHLAETPIAGDVETSNRDVASTLLQFWLPAQEYMLEKYRPDMASETAALTLIETAPNDNWGYSYRYPNDCLYFKGFVIGLPNGTTALSDTTDHKIGSDSTARLIFSNYGPTATADYIKRFDQPSDWPATWAIALSYFLAWLAASSITDSRSLRTQAKSDGKEAALDAIAVSRSERSQGTAIDATGIAARS